MSWKTLIRDEMHDITPYDFPRTNATIKLDANESPYAIPDDLANALAQLLREVPLNRYPDSRASELRGLFAAELDVAPNQIVFGNGSDEFIPLLVQTFSKPRRGETRIRVGIPVPSFSMYRIATVASGALPLEFGLRDDFALDALVIQRAITGGKPNVMFFARPNNPTGTLWDREVIEGILDRYPDVMVVVDEAYGEYASETMVDAISKYPNLVVLRSMSKVGLAGIRLGVLVAQAEVAQAIEKVRMPFNVNALTQRAAMFLLGSHRDRLRERTNSILSERERLSVELAKRPGVQVFPSHANFVLARVPDTLALWKKLAEKGVLVRKFAAPPVLTHCLRITVGSPEENDAFLKTLDTIMPSLTPDAPSVPEVEPEPESDLTDDTDA